VTLADSFSRIANSSADWHQVQSIWDQNNEFTRSGSHDPDSATLLIVDSNKAIPYRTSRHALWKTFYKTPAHFYEVDVKDFYLRVNPMIRLAVGRETVEGVTTFINQRGISIRGGVGKSVFFQTSLYDSQVRFPNYINSLHKTME
jgi:hypothetical protein